jgi:prepilin-type processing-associated H-X9-DG protein
MRLYANENDGRYPPNPESLLLTQDISTEIFICASSDDVRARSGSGTAELLAIFRRSGHNSFVYSGNGHTTSSPEEVILLYEPITNHDNDGSNFLFADGHVDFQTRRRAQAIINELNAGHNPPRAEVLKATGP